MEPLAIGFLKADRRATASEPSMLQDGHAVPERLGLIQVVGGENDRATWV